MGTRGRKWGHLGMKQTSDYRREFGEKFNDNELVMQYLAERNLFMDFEQLKEQEFRTWLRLKNVRNN